MFRKWKSALSCLSSLSWLALQCIQQRVFYPSRDSDAFQRRILIDASKHVNRQAPAYCLSNRLARRRPACALSSATSRQWLFSPTSSFVRSPFSPTFSFARSALAEHPIAATYL